MCIWSQIKEEFMVLTWLQAAVKEEDDHNETSQTQGETHPSDFGFPHAESLQGSCEREAVLMCFSPGSTLSRIIGAWIRLSALCSCSSSGTSWGVLSCRNTVLRCSVSRLPGLQLPVCPGRGTGTGCISVRGVRAGPSVCVRGWGGGLFNPLPPKHEQRLSQLEPTPFKNRKFRFGPFKIKHLKQNDILV